MPHGLQPRAPLMDYWALKNDLQNEFRPRVFARDGHRCRACRRRDLRLELAHVVPAYDYWRLGRRRGLYLSYDLRNLLTLCGRCHWAQENPGKAWYVPTLKKWFARKAVLDRAVFEGHLEFAAERDAIHARAQDLYLRQLKLTNLARERVLQLFDRIVADRGFLFPPELEEAPSIRRARPSIALRARLLAQRPPLVAAGRPKQALA